MLWASDMAIPKSVWRVTVPPGEAVPFILTPEAGRLHLTRVTVVPGELDDEDILSLRVGEGSTLSCQGPDGEPIKLCSLAEGVQDCTYLDLYSDQHIKFIVEGVAAMRLSGYTLPGYDSNQQDCGNGDDEQAEEKDPGWPVPQPLHSTGYKSMGEEFVDEEEDSEDEYADHSTVLGKGAPPCCHSRRDAASKGHYRCYKLRCQWNFPYHADTVMSVFTCVRLALCNGHDDFAQRISAERDVVPQDFARYAVTKQDAVALRFAMTLTPALDLDELVIQAAIPGRFGCLPLLLEKGGRLDPMVLQSLAYHNRPDLVRLLLEHRRGGIYYASALAVATEHGFVGVLQKLFAAGCPLWTSAVDAEAAQHRAWVLWVSPDLLCSGPVLLLAAQKGARLTPRMKEMLREVRRRALALAGCFRRAARLSRDGRANARTWGAMGKVPDDLVQRIATMAKISIVADDLVP